MHGFPDHINSKQDIENLAPDFPNEVKSHLRGLIDTVNEWQLVRVLNDTETGTTNETHKVVELKDSQTHEVNERHQYEYKLDQNAALFRLGFVSVLEAEKFLKAIK